MRTLVSVVKFFISCFVSFLALVGSAFPAFGSSSVPSPSNTPSVTSSPTPTPPTTVSPTVSPSVSPPSVVPSSSAAPVVPSPVPSVTPSSSSVAPVVPSPVPSPSKVKPSQVPFWLTSGLTAGSSRGVDVSGWQHSDDKPIDWEAVRSSGVLWAFVKCSDGSGDGNFTKWAPVDVKAASDAGLRVGCYHFAVPGVSSSDLVADAKFQAAAAVAAALSAGVPVSGLPIALDLETQKDFSSEELVVFANAFLIEVSSLTGRVPWVYSSAYFVNTFLDDVSLSKFPFWVAAYSSRPLSSPKVPSWVNVVAWQFSSAGVVDGVSSRVDLNVGLSDVVLSDGFVSAGGRVDVAPFEEKFKSVSLVRSPGWECGSLRVIVPDVLVSDVDAICAD